MQHTAVTPLLIVALALSGCATSSKDITAAYISPMQYQSYDCEQISSESQRLQAKVSQLSGRLDEAASNDKALVGVGMILFWPALFALGGTKGQEAEYARLKGEHDALQQAAVAKRCATTPGTPASAANQQPHALSTPQPPVGTPAPAARP